MNKFLPLLPDPTDPCVEVCTEVKFVLNSLSLCLRGGEQVRGGGADERREVLPDETVSIILLTIAMSTNFSDLAEKWDTWLPFHFRPNFKAFLVSSLRGRGLLRKI